MARLVLEVVGFLQIPKIGNKIMIHFLRVIMMNTTVLHVLLVVVLKSHISKINILH